MTKKLSTGIDFVDEMLEGGYETDAITTIYGPPGSGKTNLAIIAALEVAKSGKKVIYVDTEGGFSTDRAKQIMPDFKQYLDNIIFLNPTSFEEQNKAIQQLKELATNRIGLIVVDTISMMYRLERNEEESHKELRGQIKTLNEIARTKEIPVIMLSQIYQGFDDGVKIVGGDIIAYTSKSVLELQSLASGNRRLRLKKHRSIPRKNIKFKIIEKGLELTPQ